MFVTLQAHYDAASSVGAQFHLSHITPLIELSSEKLGPNFSNIWILAERAGLRVLDRAD